MADNICWAEEGLRGVPMSKPKIIDRDGLESLVSALAEDGYRVIGPIVEAGAVVYEPIVTIEDLPAGWVDEQEGGHYRLTHTEGTALFDHVVGPHTWKRYLYPPEQRLWKAVRRGHGFDVVDDLEEPRFAFIGVRACELAAMTIHDKVFDNGDFADTGYLLRRKGALVVAVNCGRSAATCFCASMGTGPKCESGFDLALTELVDVGRHDFVVEAGSDAGAKILARLPGQEATASELEDAAARVRAAEAGMTRAMPEDVAEVLRRNLIHKRWEEVGERCLGCANCTMVCPTCFCSTVEDVTDLAGAEAERIRRWDSCFTFDFSYIHGGAIRREAGARYRQWMTHKLAHWHEQFGTSGCTGCGRCITWCPVGIDITEEARAIRDSETEGRA